MALLSRDVRTNEGGILLAREHSFVQRLFALCNISTRFTKGMRANDTQFLFFSFEIVDVFANCFSCHYLISVFFFYNQIDADSPKFDVLKA